jgi:CYTH domain-containing protein
MAPTDLNYSNPLEITQHYLPNDSDGFTVRIRKCTDNGVTTHYITKKRGLTNMSCTEIENEITVVEFNKYAESAVKSVSKIRYRYKHEELTWEVDVFLGLRLIFAEVEVPSLDYVFDIPKTFSEVILMDVTGIPAFYNSSIALAI